MSQTTRLMSSRQLLAPMLMGLKIGCCQITIQCWHELLVHHAKRPFSIFHTRLLSFTFLGNKQVLSWWDWRARTRIAMASFRMKICGRFSVSSRRQDMQIDCKYLQTLLRREGGVQGHLINHHVIRWKMNGAKRFAKAVGGKNALAVLIDIPQTILFWTLFTVLRFQALADGIHSNQVPQQQPLISR